MQGKYIYSKNKIERKRIIEHEVFAMIKLKMIFHLVYISTEQSLTLIYNIQNPEFLCSLKAKKK